MFGASFELLRACIEFDEYGDGLDIFEQCVIAALLDYLGLDGFAVPGLHPIEAGRDDEASAPIEAAIRGKERGFYLIDHPLSLPDEDFDSWPPIGVWPSVADVILIVPRDERGPISHPAARPWCKL